MTRLLMFIEKCFSVSCAVSTACYKWTPSAQWEPFEANLTNTKQQHIMVTAPNLDSGSDERVPIVLGQNRATEAFDPQSGQWTPYRDLTESSWSSAACLVQYGDRVYQIGGSDFTDVNELDLTMWTTTSIGTKPDFLVNPGTCAVAKVDGVPGVMTSTGYWFNLNERTWTAKRFPPYYDNVHTAHGGMASFRGKATIFGTQHCNEEGTCDNIGVYQYEEASDEWRYLGKQVHSRDQHEIIEVPKSFCDVSPPPQTETAAMIIGGVGGGGWNRELRQTVELFGCPGRDSFLIEELPVSLYLSAGRYFEVLDRDAQELSGSVLVCGGFICQDPVNSTGCGISSECYQWTAQNNSNSNINNWNVRPEQLDQGRWAQLLAAVVDVNSGSNTKVPLLLGQEEETIIYDYLQGEWEEYLNLEETNWLSMGCFIQHEDNVYHIATEVHSLNTLTWETKLISEVPEILARYRGKCAISVIEGVTGKS